MRKVFAVATALALMAGTATAQRADYSKAPLLAGGWQPSSAEIMKALHPPVFVQSPVHTFNCQDVPNSALIIMANRAPELYRYDAHVTRVYGIQVLSTDSDGSIVSCSAKVETDYVNTGLRYGGTLIYQPVDGNRIRYEAHFGFGV